MGKAFLKWAGGKRWLVNSENHRFPATYNRYIEPFLGSGAVFFYLEPNIAILSDVNQELVNTYIAVRDNVDLVYSKLKVHSHNHSQEYYYRIRAQKTRTMHTLAARMIYLNKACFNGIYRVNKEGKFNVPYGNRDEIIFDKEKMKTASYNLHGAQILCQDFENTIEMAMWGDFLFCDPPYAVIDNENRFVGYNADAFTWNDQIRLSRVLTGAMNRGVKILMTNVDHPAVRDLYENVEGFELDTVERQCFISGVTEGRRIYRELIVSANV